MPRIRTGRTITREHAARIYETLEPFVALPGIIRARSLLRSRTVPREDARSAAAHLRQAADIVTSEADRYMLGRLADDLDPEGG